MIETLKKYNLSEDNWLEELAIKIKDSVEKIGLNFAFPSQSIYIEKTQDI